MAMPNNLALNAAALGMNPEDYALMQQQTQGPMLASNDAPATQEAINAQSMSADQAPQAPAPQAPPPMQMPPQVVQAQAPEGLTAPDFSGQKSNLADMRKGLQDYLAQKQQVDLSPLAGLVDSWTGSKFAPNYKAPESPEERAAVAQKMRNMIQQGETGLSTEQSKYLTAKANQENTQAYRDQLLEIKRQNKLAEKDRADAKLGEKQNTAYATMFDKINTPRGNTAAQVAGTNILKVKNALKIISHAPNGDLNQLDPQEVALLNEEMAAVAKGGVAGEGTRDTIAAKTIYSDWAKISQNFTADPSPANLGAFVARNKKYLDDLFENSYGTLQNYGQDVYRGHQGLLNHAQKEQFKTDFDEHMKGYLPSSDYVPGKGAPLSPVQKERDEYEKLKAMGPS